MAQKKKQSSVPPVRSNPVAPESPVISKKLLIAFAAVLSVLTISTLMYQREEPFLPQQLQTSTLNTDIPKLYVAYFSRPADQTSALAFLESKKIMTGNPDGTFRPDALMNRAELAKTLVAAIQGPGADSKLTDTICFSDVPTTEWYAKYVCEAKKMGWLNGYTDGTFKPTQTVAQAEGVKMITSALQLNAAMATELKVTVENGLVKVEKVTPWAKEAYETAMSTNILPESLLDPAKATAPMTRMDIAATLFRAITVDTLKTGAYTPEQIPTLFKAAGVALSVEPPPTTEPKAKTPPAKAPRSSRTNQGEPVKVKLAPADYR